MTNPSTSAAPFRLFGRRRVRVGKGWVSLVFGTLAPLAAIILVLVFGDTEARLVCWTDEPGEVLCEVAHVRIFQTTTERGRITRGAPARVERVNVGDSGTTFAALGTMAMELHSGAARRVVSRVNAMLDAPPGERFELAYPRGEIWISLPVILVWMLLGTWVGRSAAVELDSSSAVVRVLRSSFFGPPKEIGRWQLSEIEAVSMRLDQLSKDRTFRVALQLRHDAVEVVAAVSDRTKQARAIAKLLGVPLKI